MSLTFCCSASGQDELVYHMVANCRMRVVVCVLCSHRARLPDMLLHLRLHQVRGGHRLHHGVGLAHISNRQCATLRRCCTTRS